MTKPRPPSSSFNGYELQDRAVVYVGKKDEIPVMTGVVWVDEPVKCPLTGNISYLLEVQPISEERCSLRVTPDRMTPKHLKKILGERGIIVHEESHLARYLSMTAAHGDYLEKPPRTLIERPGWFADGKGFYLGREAITAKDVQRSSYRFEPIGRSPFAVKGTLQSWQENVGIHVQRNPVLLGVACIFIASPFLKAMGMGSRLVNVYGAKGTAKTLASQCAASILGNGIDSAAGLDSADAPYVTKFSTTANGIEPLLSRYSPLPIALDELTEQDGGILANLLYKMSSGEGKHRMTTNMEAAEVMRWQLAIVSTSERPVADAVIAGGKPLLGGQADRAIDIPVDRVGVITEFGNLADFQSITRHLKKACGEHYGTAGKAILQYAVDHPEEISGLVGTMEGIEERLLPANCGHGERRVVKFLAAAAVAGHIAVAAGVFNCTADDIEAAVQLLVNEWWRGRGGSLRRIAEFLHANGNHVINECPTLGSSAKAFIHEERVIIPDRVFRNEFGNEADRLVDELWGLNALVREQQNRNKHRFCNNRLFAYVIQWDRVEPILQELAERDGANNGSESNEGVSPLDEKIA